MRDESGMKRSANEYIKQLEIKCTSESQKVRELSGGNQQKICLAKAFDLNPELLFVSEPTRGIDIGAKSLVLDALKKYNKENRTTIVMISSELEELRSICDRIAIVTEGKISGILDSGEPAEEFGLLMADIKHGERSVNSVG
jgi:simple sugar transport system ATP-binding protein